MKEGHPAAGYFAFGSIALLFAAGDLRTSVGLFIAAASLFIGRARIFPAALRETNLLVLLSVVPLVLGLYWFFRVARRTSL
jgi:hypothetical protein